jgi:hypothetical protein
LAFCLRIGFVGLKNIWSGLVDESDFGGSKVFKGKLFEMIRMRKGGEGEGGKRGKFYEEEFHMGCLERVYSQQELGLDGRLRASYKNFVFDQSQGDDKNFVFE